jgi:phosphoglycolate phosphatase
MAFHGVIFDLDGTLLDTLGDLAGSMNQVLGDLGFPEHPVEAYKIFIGDGMLNLARRALPPAARRDEVARPAAAALREAYSQRWGQQTRPYPGIRELLDRLNRWPLKLGVLTNKPDDLAKVMVGAFFPEIHWDAVWGAAPTRPLKPDPAGALALARTWALAPASLVLVGDSAIDMQTAAAAGMYAAGALWGFRSEAELQAAGAQFLLPAPADLITLFT